MELNGGMPIAGGGVCANVKVEAAQHRAVARRKRFMVGSY